MPIDRILAPFRAFAERSAAGGILLLAATLIAVAWVNSPWAQGYEDLWSRQIGLTIGSWTTSHDLHFWINDGLMALFFLVVGLEIKREVMVGELGSIGQAALPAAAALGGAILPAILFVLVVGTGSPAVRGWGVPMATDIAFALGVLTLLAQLAPPGLRVFMTALAIVDDLLAVVVIALFYSERTDLVALAAAGVVILLLLVMNRLGVRWLAVYVVLGVALWFAVLQSGIHPAIAGVVLAFTFPSRTHLDDPAFVEVAAGRLQRLALQLRGDSHIEEHHATLWEIEDVTVRSQAPMLRLEHALQPWVAFGIVPLFALANAGIRIPADLGAALVQPVVIGIVAGLVAGKQIGIFAASWVVIRSGTSMLPSGAGWRHMYGAAWLGGIGFTMSLFVAELAFPDEAMLEAAKLGILLASVVAGIGGSVVLLAVTRAGAVREGGTSTSR